MKQRLTSTFIQTWLQTLLTYLKRYKLILSLLVLCGVVVSLSRQEFSPAPTKLSSNFPDAIIHEFASYRFNEQGQLEYRLSANKLVHFNKDDHSSLSEPLLLIDEDIAKTESINHTERTHWKIRAQQGEVYQKSHQLILSTQVTLNAYPKTEASPYQLETNYLEIDTQSQIAKTQSKIALLTTNSKTHAKGMTANLKQRQVQLHQEVTSLYEASLSE